MKKTITTISIPTFNSEQFLPVCLKAIKAQSSKDIEVNIVDGGSKDNTLALAKKLGVSDCYISNDALLKARFLGVIHARGKYVLLLDSDQVLEKTAINRAVKLCEEKGYDMLVFEEGVHNPNSFIGKLFCEDRKLIHIVKDFSPFTGVMLPRFYRRELLFKAMKQIPPQVRKIVGGQDHAIIYFEAWKLSQKVGFLPNAVNHIEPDSPLKIWRKFYRWGRTSVSAHYGQYNELLAKKERFRSGMFTKGTIKASLASVTLLFLKGVPFKIGYFAGKISHQTKK